jgi:hypothetical protein
MVMEYDALGILIVSSTFRDAFDATAEDRDRTKRLRSRSLAQSSMALVSAGIPRSRNASRFNP